MAAALVDERCFRCTHAAPWMLWASTGRCLFVIIHRRQGRMLCHDCIGRQKFRWSLFHGERLVGCAEGSSGLIRFVVAICLHDVFSFGPFHGVVARSVNAQNAKPTSEEKISRSAMHMQPVLFLSSGSWVAGCITRFVWTMRYNDL